MWLINNNMILLIVFAYHLMLITNNSYFYEFNNNYRQQLKQGHLPVYDNYWISIYLLSRGIYFFTVLIGTLLTLMTIPNVFTILFAFEFLKSYSYNKWWHLINNIGVCTYIILNIKTCF
jgi:hypothetical protein